MKPVKTKTKIGAAFGISAGLFLFPASQAHFNQPPHHVESKADTPPKLPAEKLVKPGKTAVKAAVEPTPTSLPTILLTPTPAESLQPEVPIEPTLPPSELRRLQRNQSYVNNVLKQALREQGLYIYTPTHTEEGEVDNFGQVTVSAYGAESGGEACATQFTAEISTDGNVTLLLSAIGDKEDFDGRTYGEQIYAPGDSLTHAEGVVAANGRTVPQSNAEQAADYIAEINDVFCEPEPEPTLLPTPTPTS